MESIINNLDTILSIIAATHVVAIAIVNLTSTPTDDKIVSGFYKVVEILAGIVTPKAKEPAVKRIVPIAPAEKR